MKIWLLAPKIEEWDYKMKHSLLEYWQLIVMDDTGHSTSVNVPWSIATFDLDCVLMSQMKIWLLAHKIEEWDCKMKHSLLEYWQFIVMEDTGHSTSVNVPWSIATFDLDCAFVALFYCNRYVKLCQP